MKATKIFLAVIFVMAISFGVKAQDKYEYATVIYSTTPSGVKGLITVSYENKYEETEVKVTEGNTLKNFSPVIATLNKMNQEGWEVFNESSGVAAHYYLLKKKKI